MSPLSRAAAIASAAYLVLTGAPMRASGQQPPSRADSAARDSLRRTVLRPVTIVATPAARAEPVDATHVDASTIQMTPAHNPYDLLRQAAGVEVHEQGQGPGFASDASLRGFSSDHSTDLALWIDGVPINEPVNGHAEGYNDFSLLFPGGVSDIDVIRGPTSALFGNFAIGGVVNVRTLERMKGTEFTADGGSFGRGDAMLLTGFDHGARGGGVLGAHFQHEDGFRPNAGFDLGQGHARIVHDFAPGWTIDAGTELYGTHWRSAGFLSEDEFAAHDYSIVSNGSDGGFKQRGQERVSLRFISNAMLWRTTAYATQGRWQLFLTIPPAGGRFEGSGSQTEEEDHRNGYGLTSALTWEGGHGELTVGTEGRWDHTHYENYFTTVRARDSVNALVTARQLSGALFAQSHYDVGDRLRFDLGARFDELATNSAPDGDVATSAGHGVFSPKLGALVHVTPEVGVYANASRGFRSTDGVISDPTLAPIVVWNYETGLKLDRDLNGSPLSATATIFRMNVSNEQTFNQLTGEANNGGASRRQGVELDAHVPVTAAANVTANWTFLDARYQHITAVSEEDETEPPAVLDGLRVYNTAKYIGTAALEIAPLRAWWSVRLAGNWVGPYSPFDEPGVVLGSYGLAHVSGSAQWRAVRLEVGVRNVFDRAYPELIAGHVVDPGQPRALFTTLRTTF
ncbi:MAG TPA: TonB-dependent receptor [Gemmatimonadaceae bacterium]|jgi:outer membrane receptor protein involved in Fe transport